MLPKKIYIYVSKQFIKSIFIFSIFVIFLIVLIDISDTIRSLSDKNNVNYVLILMNSLYKLPFLMLTVTPFLILFSAFYTIRSIVLKRELDIYKASGLSVWQFLQPFMVITLLWSILAIGILSPLHTILIPHQTQIQLKLSQKSNQQTISSNANIVWIILKESAKREKIILANKGFYHNKVFYFNSLSILNLHKEKFANSLIAKHGVLKNNTLYLKEVSLYQKNNPLPKTYKTMKIPIKLKKNQIRSLSLAPEELFFWQLPNFIKDLKHSGISTTQYTLYFYNLLSLPLTLLAMVFISMRFSLYDLRSGKKIYALVLTVVAGFCIFLITNIISSIASLDIVKPSVLILTSQLIILLISINLVLKKEGY